MYPNKKYPSYGIFVKKTLDMLQEKGFVIDKTVIYKSSGKFAKLIDYIIHYLKVTIKLIFYNYDYAYIHYASHNALPVLISKLIKRKMRIVINVHGSDVVPETAIQEKLQILVKRLLQISTLVIVPSDYFRNLVIEKYDLKNRIEISPSGGIDSEIFKPQSCSLSELGLNENNRYLGYVGRIDFEKGWDDLLKSFCSLKGNGGYSDVKLIIVGNGKFYLELKNQIKKYNLQNEVVLFDTLPHEKLRLIYNIIYALVFPTRRKGESLGLVGLESMACATPVIGSDIGGLRSYIKHNENGLLFTPGDVNELKEMICTYLNFSTEKILEMKANALSTSLEYNRERIKEKFISLF